jgi:hypothetical protein
MINIRASMLPSYQDCPRRSAAGQFRDIITSAGYTLNQRPQIVGIAVGQGLHAGVKLQAETFISSGSWGSIDDAIESGIDRYHQDIKDGVLFDNNTVSSNEAEKQIITQVKSFVYEVTPHIHPIQSERKYYSMIDKEFEFTGSPDLIDSASIIDDIKGGAKSRPYHGQFGGYALLRRANGEPETTGCRVWHMPRVSTKKNYPGATLHEYDVKLCILSASYTVKQIKNNVNSFLTTKSSWAFPANPLSMMCSDKYCTAYGTDFCEFKCKGELL